MQLLSPDQVKTEGDTKEEERKERIRKLNEEESNASSSLNETRNHVESEKQRLSDELVAYEKSTDERKKELQLEVSSLEAKRADAMKPIHEIQAEAEVALVSAKKRESEADENNRLLIEERSALSERMSDIVDRETAVVEKEQDLYDRERKIEGEEKRLKESSEKLAAEWLKFHKEVNSANDEIARGRKEVEDGKKANESYKNSLDEVTKLHAKERKAIKDGYDSLAKAQKEILGENHDTSKT